MTVDHRVNVVYENGAAVASIGAGVIRVDRRDDPGRETFCPVELVSAALGT